MKGGNTEAAEAALLNLQQGNDNEAVLGGRRKKRSKKSRGKKPLKRHTRKSKKSRGKRSRRRSH